MANDPGRAPALTEAFDLLAETLRGIAQGRPFVFVLNPGNWGDSLIRAGAEAFLAHYGFRCIRANLRDFRGNPGKVEELRLALKHPDPVFLFNGNGMMKPGNKRLPEVAALTQRFSTAIFLPATYSFDPRSLDFLPNSHFLIREEAQSRRFLPQAPLFHDMAVFLTFPGVPPGQGVGFMFRRDSEAPADQKIPRGNVDISDRGKTDTPIDGFIAHIARFQTVHTNRLHVGIAAALLGRDCHLYANGYSKNAAIHDHSLKPHFPNVTFSDRYEVPASQVEPAVLGRMRRLLGLA